MLPRDQPLPYASHYYSVHLCRTVKWRTLAAKSVSKDGLGSGGKKKSKYNKGRRKAP